MELKIQGRNLDLNERLRQYIARKVERLRRHLPGLGVVQVELNEEKTRAQDHRVVVQVSVDVSGTILNGQERGANAFVAIDAVIDVMDRRIQRYKGKAYKSERAKKRRQASPRYRQGSS